MSFKMIHENYNVSDLDRSIKFYGDALDLHEVRRKTTDDFIIVYLSNDSSDFELELTWLKEHPQPYDLGECEFHLAFKADDFDLAHKKAQDRLAAPMHLRFNGICRRRCHAAVARSSAALVLRRKCYVCLCSVLSCRAGYG